MQTTWGFPMLNAQAVGPDQAEAAIQRIAEAGRRVPRGEKALVMALHRALDELQDAVDEARSLGVASGAIEDALGIWRGSATTDITDSAGAQTRGVGRPRLRLVD
jgi:hypothetical protein